jgi:hypothetical protein
VAWKYRIALRAWPGQIRRDAGADMLSTLADADAHRGRSSTREAVALLTGGIRVRARDRRTHVAFGLTGMFVLVVLTVVLQHPASDPPVAPDPLQLSVFRHATHRDQDPQVRQTVHEMRLEHHLFRGVVATKARLLGKAPSGSAYVLVPVRHYLDASGFPAGRTPEWKTNGLFLDRRGTQGGAGHMVSPAQFRHGELYGALAGYAYGVVPDGVVTVRAPGGRSAVKVNRNFFVYPARLRGPIPQPDWYDANGHVVPKR